MPFAALGGTLQSWIETVNIDQGQKIFISYRSLCFCPVALVDRSPAMGFPAHSVAINGSGPVVQRMSG
jgi:hypothetical protein